MINDQCDVIGCDKRATTEIEVKDGEYHFVCDTHIEGEVVRTTPNEFETHIYKEPISEEAKNGNKKHNKNL